MLMIMIIIFISLAGNGEAIPMLHLICIQPCNQATHLAGFSMEPPIDSGQPASKQPLFPLRVGSLNLSALQLT